MHQMPSQGDNDKVDEEDIVLPGGLPPPPWDKQPASRQGLGTSSDIKIGYSHITMLSSPGLLDPKLLLFRHQTSRDSPVTITMVTW